MNTKMEITKAHKRKVCKFASNMYTMPLLDILIKMVFGFWYLHETQLSMALKKLHCHNSRKISKPKITNSFKPSVTKMAFANSSFFFTCHLVSMW